MVFNSSRVKARFLVAPLEDMRDPIYNEFTVSAAFRTPPLEIRPLRKGSWSQHVTCNQHADQRNIFIVGTSIVNNPSVASVQTSFLPRLHSNA
jgi:hypothetical protein